MRIPVEWKNKHVGQRCFVAGTGPSLNNIDLTKLKGEFVVGCNLLFRKMWPNILCMSDNRRWADWHKEIIKSRDSYGQLVLSSPPCPKVPVWAYSVPMDLGRRVYNSQFDPDLGSTCWHRTVIMDLCLPLVLYMGFSEVYLIGCDSTHVGHFYNPGVPFEMGERASFTELDRAWAVFRDMFAHRDRLLKNATFGGRDIPVPRVPYVELFNEDSSVHTDTAEQ